MPLLSYVSHTVQTRANNDTLAGYSPVHLARLEWPGTQQIQPGGGERVSDENKYKICFISQVDISMDRSKRYRKSIIQ